MATTIITTVLTIALLRFLENLIMEWKQNRSVSGGPAPIAPIDYDTETWISRPEKLPVHLQATRKVN